MTEIMAAGAVTALSERELERAFALEAIRGNDGPGETLGDQVLGILLEVLEGPGMAEEAKDRLRLRIAEYREHPERALLEHLREVRSATEASADAVGSVPARPASVWPDISWGLLG